MREWLAYFAKSRTNRITTFPSLYPSASVLYFPGGARKTTPLNQK
jgi:hypothetical protein